MEERIARTISALEHNNMRAVYVESRREVLPLVKELLFKGATIGVGGSVTLGECGITELIRGKDYHFFDRYKKGLTPEEVRKVNVEANSADFYFSGCNAITEDGLLYNVDGNANRVSAIAFGPQKVIIVAGVNKIVKNLDEAVLRVKKVAAPLNAKRLDCKTFCAEKGYCVSLERGGEMGDGCSSDDRICCQYLVSGRQRVKNRIQVIIVNESLGF